LARGLPCERFTAALASRTSCITRGRGGWLNLPRGGLPPPILCQLFLAHSVQGDCVVKVQNAVTAPEHGDGHDILPANRAGFSHLATQAAT